MYTNRRYRSNVVSRARRNMRAADSQRDSTTTIINTSLSVTCGQTSYDPDGNNLRFIDSGCAAINIYDVIRKSGYYKSFSSMYDQFKIDNIKARITAVNWVNGNNVDNDNQQFAEWLHPRSYVICTAWDRSGLNKDQLYITTKQIGFPDPQDPENRIFEEANVQYCVISRNISTYSSAQTKHLGSGGSYEIIRQLYPSNVIEKEQYLYTKSLIPQYYRQSDDGYVYKNYYIDNNHVINFNLNPEIPNNLLSSPSVPFKPTLLLNVYPGPRPTNFNVNINANGILEEFDESDDAVIEGINQQMGGNKIKPVTFNIEFDIAVTFRGLRYERVVNKFKS